MILYDALETLRVLQSKKRLGGSTFKKINLILSQEATTHNLEEAAKLLEELTNETKV